MEFDAALGQYTFAYEGLLFAWDEAPEEGYRERVKTLAQNYRARLPEIIAFMTPDLVAAFGQCSPEAIQARLGRPVIDCDNGQVNYLEQSFDDTHIFTFEFSDDGFMDLQYFSIDG